jgi:hypothetical protein
VAVRSRSLARIGAIVLAIAAASAGVWAVARALESMDPNPACMANDTEACSSTDGYPIGRRVDCTTEVGACAEELRLTRFGLDTFAPTHAQVLREAVFDIDLRRVCGGVLCTFSSEKRVVVFDFADGTKRAIGYECAGIAPCQATRTWHGWNDAVALPS